MKYNKDFLTQLQKENNRTIFARITALTKDERVLEYIEGTIINGSISVDGQSALRRTCNLTLSSKKQNISNFFWSFSNKFKLEIGLKNSINLNYPNIIWFPQGIFIITSFSNTLSTNSNQITISGKDKMCLLNGDIGGIFNSQIDFGKIEQSDKNGNIKIVKIPVKQIIREMIHQYAEEPFYNIIINDLDDNALELQEYKLDKPLYMFKKLGSNLFETGFIDDQYPIGYLDETNSKIIQSTVSQVPFYEPLIKTNDLNITPTQVFFLDDTQNQVFFEHSYNQVDNNNVLKLSKGSIVEDINIEKKEDNFLYLSLPSGQENNLSFYHTIDKKDKLKLQILSKQKAENNSKGNFTQNNPSQVFYTIAKIEYGDMAGYKETDLVFDGDLIANAGDTITSVLDKIKTMLVHYEYFYDLDGQFIFQKKNRDQQITNIFEGNQLLTAFADTPDLKSVRNDFTVWGKRKSISGAELPIHARLGIQKHPTVYKSIEVTDKELETYNKIYGLNKKGQTSVIYSTKDYDWRELIYQMSLDYHGYNHLDDFELKIIEANPDIFPTGKTGYEQYYIDMEGFWRQLYNPNVERELIEQEQLKAKQKEKIDELNKDKEKNTILIQQEEFKLSTIESKIKQLQNFYTGNENLKYWNKDIVENPEILNFYFDLIDTEGELSLYSVDAIGDRPKVNNNDRVKAISYREVPYVIFYSGEAPDNQRTGYRYFNIGSLSNAFKISTQGKSTKEELENLISNYSYCVENVSVTAIPVYDLEPNSLIKINNLKTGINGEYSVNKYTLSLNYNSTINLTVTKNIKPIY